MILMQVMEYLKRLSGDEYVGFSNATWVLQNITVLRLLELLSKVVLLQFPVGEGDRWQELRYWLLPQREKSEFFMSN